MFRIISIKLSKIKYFGGSVGRDIRIETEILSKFFRVDKRIKAGAAAEINKEIGRFETDKNFFVASVEITVIEKDLLFNDVGSTTSSIKINTSVKKPQQFSFEIEVKETRLFGFWGKRTARFELTLEAEVSDTLVVLTQYTYEGVNENENYNRHDTVIKEAVDYWNNEFLKDTDPPKESLDPSLVKAMLYQESRVGYYPGAEINVMQIGKSGDPSLEVLRGESIHPEYWIHNGKQEILKYTDAKVETVKDSIFWGVRWLYHKAQGITKKDPTRRYWRSWKEAVERYGPPGFDKEYVNSVWGIYKNGIKKEKNNHIKLWDVVLIVGLVLVILFSWQNKNEFLKKLTIDTFYSERRLEVEDVEIKFNKYSPSFFTANVMWKKDWWENLKAGELLDQKVNWLEIEKPPSEQSIRSVRFINLQGFDYPILEVYGETHMGHGNLYLYKVRDEKLTLIFETPAVDYYYDHAWDPDNYKKYGYGTCSRSYENGQLSAKYKDINHDGISDLVLEGKINLTCDEERFKNNMAIDTTDVKIAEIPIRQIYFWDKNRQTFLNNVVY